MNGVAMMRSHLPINYVLTSFLALSACSAVAASQDVTDKPSSSETAPASKAAKAPIDPEQRRKDFQQRDKNQDGQLTLSEHLGQRQGTVRESARDNFFRSDANGDDLLSLDEFLSRDPSKQPTVHSLFRLLDADDDGQLAFDEFIRTRLGKKGEQSGRDNFEKFDLNRDGRLNEREFALLPSNKPDRPTLFRGLDLNEDGELTLDEQLLHLEGRPRLAARDQFFRLDLDENERLSLEEYLNRNPDTKLSTHSSFRQHDLDDDQKLTEEEFMRTKVGKDWEQGSRASFHRFDVNQDGRLNEHEFAMTAAQKPTAETMFLGLDANEDGFLSRSEFLATFVATGKKRGQTEFLSHDHNRDGKLSLEEYTGEALPKQVLPKLDFNSLDVNADGSLTLLEFGGLSAPQTDDEKDAKQFQVSLMRTEVQFLAADADRDRSLSREEFNKVQPSGRGAMEIDEDAIDPTDVVFAAPESHQGVGSRSIDIFLIFMVVGEGALCLALIKWWLAFRRRA